MTKSISQYPLPYDSPKSDEIWANIIEYCKNNKLSIDFTPTQQALSASLSGNSPYLAQLILRDPSFFIKVLRENPDTILQTELAQFLERPCEENTDTLMRALRVAKAHIALLTATMDVSQEWGLDKVTHALSTFAKCALSISTAHLLYKKMIKGELALPPEPISAITKDIANGTGYVVLALGKLGPDELNYSSDVDIIVLYDQEIVNYTGKRSQADCFVKITQELVHIMEHRTMDGYVFRTDLRLRPDPGATALALSMNAAETYYHSLAQNWERSAMIKATVVAGDLKAGNEYLERMSGWVWRRSMDFEAIRDIKAIKNQILRHYHQEETQFEGFDVKLGQGGIREIEFYAQVNQLLFGGKMPQLRSRSTLAALDALVSAGKVNSTVRDDLKSAYIFLRTLEHRLQMINDEQTHVIPQDDEALLRVAIFMGYENSSILKSILEENTLSVSKYYDNLMPEDDDEITELTGNSLLSFLKENDYPEPKGTFQIIDTWQRGRYRALKTPRARKLLSQCLPGLLTAFMSTSEPAAALTRFDRFIRELPAGVQVFSLFQSNPALFQLIARIMGLAPALAEQLAKRPTLFEAVLDPSFFESLPSTQDLMQELEYALKAARDYQDILDITRRYVSERRFQVGVQVLESLSSTIEAGEAMTRLADATLKVLTPAVETNFSIRHGSFKGGGLGILAMGKYGGRELTHTSDLDVVFLYHCEDMNSTSDGERPLAPSQYFSKLGQNVITAITALTAEGSLFEVDTRLRPSGTAGPLVVTLKTFADYYTKAAWTWEHMALTRARLVVCPDKLAKPLMATITSTLQAHRDKKNLLKSVAEMRQKLVTQFNTDNLWSIKHTRGGLIDMEFICQYLVLREGHKIKDLFSPILDDAFEMLEANDILPKGAARKLKHAHRVQQTVQSMLRLCLGDVEADETTFSTGLKFLLAKSCGFDDIEHLKSELRLCQADVSFYYQDIIADPVAKQYEKE